MCFVTNRISLIVHIVSVRNRIVGVRNNAKTLRCGGVKKKPIE